MTPTRARTGLPAALTAVVLALAAASSAGADGRYTDATGDGGPGTDITTVGVSTDAAGRFTIRIGFDGLSPTAATALFLDTDLDPATGSPGTQGAEYSLVVVGSSRPYFTRWNGTDDEVAPASTLSVESGPGAVTISIDRSELGNAAGFDFWVLVNDGDASDSAPGGTTWNYLTATGGPEIRGVLTRVAPRTGPSAGKLFTVVPTGVLARPGDTRVTPPKPDSYSCTATLGGRALAGRGPNACTWRMPRRKVRGKRLAVALTVALQGASRTFRLVYPVR